MLIIKAFLVLLCYEGNCNAISWRRLTLKKIFVWNFKGVFCVCVFWFLILHLPVKMSIVFKLLNEQLCDMQSVQRIALA